MNAAATVPIVAPQRVSRTYTQSLVGTAGEVFPLLCPVRELEWEPEWRPKEVRSISGLAELDCVFLTPADDGGTAIWMITRHDPASHAIQMVKLTPGVTACRLDFEVRDVGEHASEAVVTYTHTSLGPKGDALVEGFSEMYYAAFMRDWESKLNAYLQSRR